MFEIGFPEVLVIAAITLVVVGPEKIPQLIKTVSLFLKRLRLYFENIKQEIEKEINADEIRAQIHNQIKQSSPIGKPPVQTMANLSAAALVVHAAWTTCWFSGPPRV